MTIDEIATELTEAIACPVVAKTKSEDHMQHAVSITGCVTIPMLQAALAIRTSTRSSRLLSVMSAGRAGATQVHP